MPTFDVQHAVKSAQAILFLIAAKRPEQALKRIPELLASAPDWHLAHLTHAQVLLVCDRYDETIVAAQRSLACEPNQALALRLIALAHSQLNRNDEAWERINDALACDPNLAVAHYTRAQIARALGRPDEALRSLHRAIALDPDDVDAFLLMVELLDWRANPDEARARLYDILKLDPLDARVFYRLAQLALEEHDFEDAARWLVETLRQDPTHKLAASVLGTIETTRPLLHDTSRVGELMRALLIGVVALQRHRLPQGARRLSHETLGVLIAKHQRFVDAQRPDAELHWERSILGDRSYEHLQEADIPRLGDLMVLRDYELDGLEVPTADLRHANLSASTLRATTFETCDLRGAIAVDVVAHEVRFVNCALGRFDVSDSRFEACVFDGGNADAFDAERATFERCTFIDIALANAHFGSATFIGCTFTNAALSDEQRAGCTITD